MSFGFLSDSRFLSLDSDLFWLQRWGLPVVYAKKDGFHLSMPSPHDLQRVLNQPVCIMLQLGLTHSSCVVTRVYFLCDILWPEFQSHSDTSRMHATGLHSARVLAQAHPTKSCIHLIYECFPVTSKVDRYCSCLLCCVNSSSGNCTPGSRFYSNLSVCIHQLILKCCSSLRLLA